jgi:hypothetical protein
MITVGFGNEVVGTLNRPHSWKPHFDQERTEREQMELTARGATELMRAAVKQADEAASKIIECFGAFKEILEDEKGETVKEFWFQAGDIVIIAGIMQQAAQKILDAQRDMLLGMPFHDTRKAAHEEIEAMMNVAPERSA